nr:chorismate-binding protein [Robertkochia sp. 3YJGBD-33]
MIYIPAEHQLSFSSTDLPEQTGSNTINLEVVTDLSAQKEAHMFLVKRAIDQIRNSELKKVVVSRRIDFRSDEVAPLQLFQRLRTAYPAAMVYCWYHPQTGYWMGATPETLMNIEGNKITTMSLAGTQTFNGTEKVHWGNKEIEEQALVTEAILEALKPFADSPEKDEVATVRAGNLLHLRTMVSARFDPHRVSPGELARALHPTPAVGGLPAKAAVDFLDRHENYDRSYYTGYFGEINLGENENRKSRLFVNLRCCCYRDGLLSLYAGGGITQDSDPEREWQETENKAETILRVLRQ